MVLESARALVLARGAGVTVLSDLSGLALCQLSIRYQNGPGKWGLCLSLSAPGFQIPAGGGLQAWGDGLLILEKRRPKRLDVTEERE